jgi:hypothetical protein
LSSRKRKPNISVKPKILESPPVNQSDNFSKIDPINYQSYILFSNPRDKSNIETEIDKSTSNEQIIRPIQFSRNDQNHHEIEDQNSTFSLSLTKLTSHFSSASNQILRPSSSKHHIYSKYHDPFAHSFSFQQPPIRQSGTDPVQPQQSLNESSEIPCEQFSTQTSLSTQAEDNKLNTQLSCQRPSKIPENIQVSSKTSFKNRKTQNTQFPNKATFEQLTSTPFEASPNIQFQNSNPSIFSESTSKHHQFFRNPHARKRNFEILQYNKMQFKLLWHRIHHLKKILINNKKINHSSSFTFSNSISFQTIKGCHSRIKRSNRIST